MNNISQKISIFLFLSDLCIQNSICLCLLQCLISTLCNEYASFGTKLISECGLQSVITRIEWTSISFSTDLDFIKLFVYESLRFFFWKMKNWSLLILLTLLVKKFVTSETRPNIIFILADDLVCFNPIN